MSGQDVQVVRDDEHASSASIIEGTSATLEAGSRSRRDRARSSLTERLMRPAPTVWLSGQEAAEYVGVSWPTLRRAILDHAIPHVRLGTRWKIDVAVLDNHLHGMATLD